MLKLEYRQDKVDFWEYRQRSRYLSSEIARIDDERKSVESQVDATRYEIEKLRTKKQSNSRSQHSSESSSRSKRSRTFVTASSSTESEAERFRREAGILKSQLEEARKQRNALQDWLENHDDELETISRESSLFKLAIKYLHDYRKMEAEVCRLKKAYGRKKEEFERASAEGKALISNSTYVKPKHISLLDTEATIEIENQFGAEETSEAYISNEQTPQEERPEQRLKEESSIHCFGSEASVSRKDVDQQPGQEVEEVMLAENTDTVQTSQSSQSDEVFIELEALNYELQELQENSLNLMKEKASLVSQLANPALTKQESRSHQKDKKRLKLIEKEIEELNEDIESLQSRIENVKLPHTEASQKPIRSPIGELQRGFYDKLNVIEVETHCTDELCLMIICQSSRLQESPKHSVSTGSAILDA